MTGPWTSEAEKEAERKKAEVLDDQGAHWPERLAGAAIMIPVGMVIGLLLLGSLNLPPTTVQYLIMGAGAAIGAGLALQFKVIGRFVCYVFSSLIYWA